MKSCKRLNCGTAGFSRVDLIGVLVTVACLVLVMLGMGASTRTAQREAVCAARVRQLSAALALYASDSSDYLPYPGWGNVPFGGDSWAYASRNPGRDPNLPTLIPDAVGKDDGSPEVAAQRGFQKLGQLWPYVGNHATYRCPADDPQTQSELTRYRGRSLKIISHAMNPSVGPYVAGGSGLPDGRTYKIAGFRGTDIAFQEIDESNPFFFNDGSNQVGEGVCSRHYGGGYLGRFDGGAEMVTAVEYMRLANQPRGPNRLICGPGIQSSVQP